MTSIVFCGWTTKSYTILYYQQKYWIKMFKSIVFATAIKTSFNFYTLLIDYIKRVCKFDTFV